MFCAGIQSSGSSRLSRLALCSFGLPCPFLESGNRTTHTLFIAKSRAACSGSGRGLTPVLATCTQNEHYCPDKDCVPHGSVDFADGWRM